MSQRDDWKFLFRACRVRDAAEKQAQHHRDREKWWRKELQAAEAALKESGIEMRSQPITGGERMVAVLDPVKSARVEECRGKVASHSVDAETYEGWMRLFTEYPDQLLSLDVQDVRYFGL